MIVVTGTARIPVENMAQALQAMKALLEATRREEGCLSYNFGRDVLEADLIIISEQWRDMAAIQAHFATPHMGVFFAAAEGFGMQLIALNAHDVASSQALG